MKIAEKNTHSANTTFAERQNGNERKPAFKSVDSDPLSVQIFTLKNGMKLYLSVNEVEPRIFTNIAVRAGSKHDPAETTGLAHYLEHMMFKGTSQIGALNWEQESAFLEKISDLYEAHRRETDPEKRKAIYAEIDRVSGEAAKLVAANEYDKLASSLGARGTNAYTWVEQTVYVNDIPSNELERWMKLESERFKMVALRLFHTELETVYEEFNISQDRDFRKVSATINKALYPSHPYGLQTTLGKGEHLKNPSHVKIQEFFKTYYQPNNMALVLAGDFDPAEAVALAEQYFGKYLPVEIPEFKYPPQPKLEKTERREVFGQEAGYVQLAWKFGGATTSDADYLTMISRILFNGRAGLIDLNIKQKQTLLEASARTTTMEDFSTFQLYGKPREGQPHEEVERLLLDELEKLKRGEFADWLLEACLKDFKLREVLANEKNNARVNQMTSAFILGIGWEDYVGRFERLEKITKAEVVRFANERLGENFVAVFKRHGDDPKVEKVDKPAITPVEVNREGVSGFTGEFLKMDSPRLAPKFVDFKKEIQTETMPNGVKLDYIHNGDNETFSLNYIVEMGRTSDRVLALAMSYLPFLGTDKYSPDELKQQFFRLGLNFNVNVNDERAYVTLGGLNESLEEGLELFEHILAHVEGNEEALKNLVADVLLRRQNSKKNKQTVLQKAMYNFAIYGLESPFTHKLSEEELRAIRPNDLVEKIRSLTSFEHRIFYFGPSQMSEVAALLGSHHRTPETFLPVLPAKKFAQLPTTKDKVVFVDFPMVQAEIMLVSKGNPQFSLDEFIMNELYNAYFGAGLSSIVFQEIRESRALAYSAFSFAGSPAKKEEAHYLRAYVGTQPDKMEEALSAMRQIIEEMPVSEEQIGHAILSIQKKIETSRIVRDSVYWSFRANQRRGFERDLRQDIYEKMKSVTPAHLLAFHEKTVKGRNFTYLVLGSREHVDMDLLRAIGPVEEMSVGEVFGY